MSFFIEPDEVLPPDCSAQHPRYRLTRCLLSEGHLLDHKGVVHDRYGRAEFINWSCQSTQARVDIILADTQCRDS